MKRGRGYSSHVTSCCLRAVIFTQRDGFLSLCLRRTLLCQIIRNQTTRRGALGMLSSRRKWPRTTRGTMPRMPQSFDEPQMGRRRSWRWSRRRPPPFSSFAIPLSVPSSGWPPAPGCCACAHVPPGTESGRPPRADACAAAPGVFTGLQKLGLFR